MLSISDVQAFPSSAISTANSCSVSHGPDPGQGRKVSGLISVSGFSRQVNLGTQLDGKVRGSLKTFDSVAGTTVQLSVDVVSLAGLNNPSSYALQLKRLEKSGQQMSLTNFLGWSDANAAGSGWVKQGTTNPYYTKQLTAGTTGTFTFQLGLGNETPVDVYDLEYAIAGNDDNGLFYADEHFYLAVIAPQLLIDSAVTWSAALSAAGYVLEVAASPAGPWQPYQGASALIEGSNVVLMKTSEGGKKFFRLHKP